MYLDCFQSIDEWMAGKVPEHAVKVVKKVCDLPGLRQ
jgi:hypothetical protein